MVAGTWLPDNPGLLAKGYRGAITQATFGVYANRLGAFARDIKRGSRKAAGANKSAP